MAVTRAGFFIATALGARPSLRGRRDDLRVLDTSRWQCLRRRI